MFQSARPRVRTRPIGAGEVAGWVVSIRAPSGEDATLRSSESLDSSQFQSARPRVRTRRMSRRMSLSQTEFQSARPRVRTRLAVPCSAHDDARFNPRALG